MDSPDSVSSKSPVSNNDVDIIDRHPMFLDQNINNTNEHSARTSSIFITENSSSLLKNQVSPSSRALRKPRVLIEEVVDEEADIHKINSLPSGGSNIIEKVELPASTPPLEKEESSTPTLPSEGTRQGTRRVHFADAVKEDSEEYYFVPSEVTEAAM